MAAPEDSSCECAAHLDVVELVREVKLGSVCLCATTP